MRKKKIVVLGGGTGTFTILSGLKKYPFELSAIVAMSDNGGSTGILRDELGVLPPGDVRQCLVALSSSDKLMRELMNYRFDNGSLKGHNFGNLLISALEKITGNFDEAVEKASEILRLRGKVIPATLNKVHLIAKLDSGKIIKGQRQIYEDNLPNLKSIELEPRAKANPKALEEIKKADAIVIAPGDLYSSIIPNFLVKGIPQAIAKSLARKIFIVNLMNRQNTAGFTPLDFVETIEKYLKVKFHNVIYNNTIPSKKLIEQYSKQGTLVNPQDYSADEDGRIWIGEDLISKRKIKVKKGDLLNRNLIRHNPDRIAKIIEGLL